MTKPTFKCWINDWNGKDDPKDIQAYNAEEAAEKFAEKYENDSAEYEDEIEVFVLDEGRERIFDITPDWSRDYYAYERKPKEESEEVSHEVERG